MLAKREPRAGLLLGGAVGWLLGYWGGADVGDGNVGTAILGAARPGRADRRVHVGGSHNPDYNERLDLDRSSRAWIFLGPGLLFIAVMLVVPTIRTAYLSLLDRDSEEFVGARQLRRHVHRQGELGRLGVDEHVHQLSLPDRCDGPGDRRGDRIPAEAAHGPRRRARQPDRAAARRRVHVRVLRRLHRHARDDHQQPVVGRDRDVLLHRTRARHRRAGRRSRRREDRQVDHLHADGAVARRCVDHLAIRLPDPGHLQGADRASPTRCGSVSANSAPAPAFPR